MTSAAKALFDCGMADPRGCEYREFELDLGWPRKYHGWVLPAAVGSDRYGIGWDGVIYSLKSVGERVDLAGDLTSMTERPFGFGDDEGWGEGEISLVASLPLRIKIAFLLRLGQVSLAETLWRNGLPTDEKPLADPFEGMAAVWLDDWYARAMQAYLHADYPAALVICRRLMAAEEKARTAARARGNPSPWPIHKFGTRFWQLPLLTTETQRRMDEKLYVSVLEFGQGAMEAVRIPALIRELEQVRVQQVSNPGETNVFDDPVVQSLAEIGDAAVPALLKCLLEDQRLTRSEYTEGMMERGPIIPVYEAAYVALFKILNKTFPLFERDGDDPRQQREPRNLSPADRQALAAKLEAYWHKIRSEDPLARAYATLRDDHADQTAWLQAIDDIVQPATGGYTEYRLVSPAVGGYRLLLDDKPFTPRGETLRSRKDPSVRDALIRRFEQTVVDDPTKPFGQRDLAGKLLIALAAWDGDTHLDDLRRLENELVARFEHLVAEPVGRPLSSDDWYGEAWMLVRVFEKRIALGDPYTLVDYCNFLAALTPRKLGTIIGSGVHFFRPMWRHPEDPVIQRTAEKVFGTGSPWVPFVKRDTHDLSELIRTPLIALNPVQRELERGLSDVSTAGQVTLKPDGTSEDIPQANTPDPSAPARGSAIAYRLCDHYAHELSFLDGFPQCELYWPQARRDQAVEACRGFLHRYANHFRYHEPEDKGKDDPSGYMSGPPIHFSVLDHPATPEDVQAGRALFTLPAPSRIVRLPGLPLAADRPSHPVNPVNSITSGGKSVVIYETRGKVWQVEETLVDGKWERFYGFVGRYQMERVPAAELDFCAETDATDITPEIRGSIETPRRTVGDEFSFSDYPNAFVASGAPLPVEVKAHNHSALDQSLPSTFILPAGAGKALPTGIHLSLLYSERIPTSRRYYSDPPSDYGAWQEVPLRTEVQTAADQGAGPVVFPGQDVALLEIDLREYLDLGRAGSYRLKAIFQIRGQPTRPSNEISFSVAP